MSLTQWTDGLNMELCGLTFELRPDRLQGTRPEPVKMNRVPPARVWRLAVEPRLEREVRPRR